MTDATVRATILGRLRGRTSHPIVLPMSAGLAPYSPIIAGGWGVHLAGEIEEANWDTRQGLERAIPILPLPACRPAGRIRRPAAASPGTCCLDHSRSSSRRRVDRPKPRPTGVERDIPIDPRHRPVEGHPRLTAGLGAPRGLDAARRDSASEFRVRPPSFRASDNFRPPTAPAARTRPSHHSAPARNPCLNPYRSVSCVSCVSPGGTR
jgi:hypothetical protein